MTINSELTYKSYVRNVNFNPIFKDDKDPFSKYSQSLMKHLLGVNNPSFSTMERTVKQGNMCRFPLTVKVVK